MSDDYYKILNDDFLFTQYSKNNDFIYENYWYLESRLTQLIDKKTINNLQQLDDKDMLVLCLYLYKSNKVNISGYYVERMHAYNVLIKRLNEIIWNKYFKHTPFMYSICKNERDIIDELLENEFIHWKNDNDVV